MASRWCRRLLALLAAGATLLLARVLARVRDVPFSPLTAGRVVGADYVERKGLAGAGDPVGEMDDAAAYARPDFDPDALHPDVRRFYERTSEFAMAYDVTWHAGFRTGAALASHLTSRIQQLNLPGPNAAGGPRWLTSRFVAIDPDYDPRDGVRGWIRTDAETGEAVFVALYASHVRDGERFTNIAAPLPGANLSTVLQLSAIDGTEDGDGIRLTTRASGDPGLYLVVPPVGVALPLAQRFQVWPVGTPGAPPDVTDGEATLVATHEMWLFGRRFLTVRYAIC